jgi:two-component system, LytTR family, response regulator LytT
MSRCNMFLERGNDLLGLFHKNLLYILKPVLAQDLLIHSRKIFRPMINCLVIDDDPAVLFYLQNFIKQTPFLNHVASHQSPNEALKTLETGSIKLIFMDIGLPEVNGLEFSRMLNNMTWETAPRVIFITSFEHFALDGYKVNAVDYLIKPVSYESFLEAALRAKSQIETPHIPAYTDNDFVFLRVEFELVKIYLKNILYLESFKDYVKVYTTLSSTYIKALSTMKNLEEKLPPQSFLRVHRSFIVSADKIDSISKNTVKIGKTIIPVSTQYRSEFKKFKDKWL